MYRCLESPSTNVSPYGHWKNYSRKSDIIVCPITVHLVHFVGEGEVCIQARWLMALRIFLPPPPQPGWDASPSPLTGLPPALQLPVPICTPGWRDTVKVMCLAQEKNAMSVLQPQSDLKMSALTMRTLCLTHRKSLAQMESNVNWIVSIVDQRIQLHCLIIINIGTREGTGPCD